VTYLIKLIASESVHKRIIVALCCLKTVSSHDIIWYETWSENLNKTYTDNELHRQV